MAAQRPTWLPSELALLPHPLLSRHSSWLPSKLALLAHPLLPWLPSKLAGAALLPRELAHGGLAGVLLLLLHAWLTAHARLAAHARLLPAHLASHPLGLRRELLHPRLTPHARLAPCGEHELGQLRLCHSRCSAKGSDCKSLWSFQG